MTSKDAVPGEADALALPKIKFRTFFETSTKGTFFNVQTSSFVTLTGIGLNLRD